MKFGLSILLLFLFEKVTAQRYLTEVFTVLDSTIGASYGTALNSSGANQSLLFDYYAPAADYELKRPLIIYIHGGGFNSSSRNLPSIQILARTMAKKGYAFVSLDYRLDPIFNLYASSTNRRAMTDAMHDSKQAIRYFKANALTLNLDTNKFFIGGESAGAITAMMASFVDKQSEMPIYPLANPNNPIGATSNASFGSTVNAVMCLCGLIVDTNAMEASNNLPILWTHGNADAFIPIALSFPIVLRATNLGLPLQTHVYEGATHCPFYFGNPNWNLYLDSTITDITTFLYPKATNSLNKFEDDNLTIYPNPVENILHLDFSQHEVQVSIKLLSLNGQVLKEMDGNGASILELDMSTISKGVYFIQVFNKEKVMVSRKILKF